MNNQATDLNLVRFIATLTFVFAAVVLMATAVGTGNRKTIRLMSILIALMALLLIGALLLLR